MRFPLPHLTALILAFVPSFRAAEPTNSAETAAKKAASRQQPHESLSLRPRQV
mgnify:CR=1 FL=1